MKRFYNRNRLNFIGMTIAAVAGTSGGCSLFGGGPSPMTAEELVDLTAGNTVQLEASDAFAYVDVDGTLRGMNTPKGGSVGRWRMREDHALCIWWSDIWVAREDCDVVYLRGENEIEWEGNRMFVLPGNPKGL